MKYLRSEDWPVRQTAIRLAVQVFRLTSTGCVSRYSEFKNPIERSAVSISNNIAEGFERGTHEKLLTFLGYRPRIGGRGPLNAPPCSGNSRKTMRIFLRSTNCSR